MGRQKRLVALQLATSRGCGVLGRLLEDLQHRGLVAPSYVDTDGHKGLAKIQRCTVTSCATSRNTWSMPDRR